MCGGHVDQKEEVGFHENGLSQVGVFNFTNVRLLLCSFKRYHMYLDVVCFVCSQHGRFPSCAVGCI